MGLVTFKDDLDHLMTPQHSKARGPVVRGESTEAAVQLLLAGEGAEPHHHLEEQWVYVLEGAIQITLDGETYVVRPGEASFHPSDVPHGSLALEDTRFVSFKNIVAPKYEASSQA
ncbi:MAG: cupin domain-containing protein [Propionibacteriaceae bacterium]|nr:cupin domain-containing protein [Propionibacteriaceae bacterium]